MLWRPALAAHDRWSAIRFVARFAIHILLGSLIFAFVALVAVYLHVFMDRILAGTNALPIVSKAIGAVELFIFAVDLVCVVAFIVKESLVLLRSMLAGARRSD